MPWAESGEVSGERKPGLRSPPIWPVKGKGCSTSMEQSGWVGVSLYISYDTCDPLPLTGLPTVSFLLES